MYNADVLLGAVGATVRAHARRWRPVLKMSIAYPLRSLFRTGVTLAMFTLVVFTLVVGAITTGSFAHAFNDIEAFGGGFDVRATCSPAAPTEQIGQRPASRTWPRRGDSYVSLARQSLVGLECVRPVQARTSTLRRRGLDGAFLDAHDLLARRPRAGTDRRRTSGSALARPTGPRGRRPSSSPRGVELQLRRRRRLPAHRLLSRGQDASRPVPVDGPRPADGRAASA